MKHLLRYLHLLQVVYGSIPCGVCMLLFLVSSGFLQYKRDIHLILCLLTNACWDMIQPLRDLHDLQETELIHP